MTLSESKLLFHGYFVSLIECILYLSIYLSTYVPLPFSIGKDTFVGIRFLHAVQSMCIRVPSCSDSSFHHEQG